MSVLQKLWYDQPVRTQIMVVLVAINLVAAVIAGAVTILNTRTATKVEIDASLEVAQRFVDVTLRDLERQGKLDNLDEELPPLLRHLRHVRIMFMGKSGQLAIVVPEGEDDALDGPSAPGWFISLIHPEVAQRKVRLLPDGSHPVIILGEPSDEINESWQDFFSLALIWFAINACVLAILYVVLGRVLDPLASLSKGMLQLEDGEYGARLPRSKVKEFAAITDRFNTLASALDVAREENESLYQQLINVQETERREIANELHDEAGPCLFGITANAASIQTTAGQLTGDQADKISNRADEILSIAGRLKTMNRALLKKLRPGPLGQVKLADLLEELASVLQSSHPETNIHTEFGELAKSYGERTDLTIYRCIQEAITNGIRHGQAENVRIDLAENSLKNGSAEAHEEIRLTITDDGKGMPADASKGFGLSTMTERVRALGGTCVIESAASVGTAVRVQIPIQPTKSEPAAQERTPEAVKELS